jgi:hypothetical protein
MAQQAGGKIEKADLCYSKGFVNLELAGADFTRVISLVFSYISAGRTLTHLRKAKDI